MRWFRRPSPEYINITKPKAAEVEDRIPKDLWHKCPKCGFESLKKDFEANLSVCPSCNAHGRIGSRERMEQLVDTGSFEETHASLKSIDPLKYDAKKKYRDDYEDKRRKTGMNDGLLSGRAKIGEVPVSIAITEWAFFGGSMGSVVGEKITRAMELAVAEEIPCITVACSGGARMQEGILSLMQMAKTSMLCNEMEKKNIPYISVLVDPVTGGVMASFASLGDFIIAEPSALVGFAGKRVIEQTIKQVLPKDFQTAEFQQSHGFVDLVVPRKHLRSTLIKLLRMLRKMEPYQGPMADVPLSSLKLSPSAEPKKVVMPA
ncbi:MAG: acetyl-CoA carboxylase, carboxyltransferase subunit beta [Candidatus Sumerlaeota bacterium]